MSQVIKLQTGGQPEQKKMGSITIGGTKYDATPEVIDELTNHLSKYGAMSAPLAGLTNALLNGADVVYDPVGNTISGMQGLWTGVNENTERKRASDRRTSKWARNWDATFNTDRHQFNKALSLLSGFRPGSASKPSDASDLSDIFGNRVWYNYDDSGKYLKDAGDNLAIAKRLGDWTTYLGMPEEEGNKSYRIGSEYDAPQRQALRQLYEQNKDNWATVLQQIGERAEQGALTAEDKAFLRNFNVYEDEAASAEAQAKKEADAAKKRYTDAGYNYDAWSPYITWNNDKGYWELTPEATESFRSNFGGNGNYWFNDLFGSSKYNPMGEYDFLKGHFVIGNRLYKDSDASNPNSDLYKLLQRSGGFRELNSQMRHGEANDLIEQLWGNEIGWERPDDKHYSNWLDPNGNIWIRSRTGQYDWIGKQPGQQLVEYVTVNPESADEFGFYTPSYRVTDAWGNIDLSKPIEDAQGLIRRSNPEEVPFHQRELWYGDSDSKFNGRYLIGDAQDENGKVTGLGIWVDPNDPTGGWIIESDKIPQLVSGLSENDTVYLPKEITQILSQNPGFLERLQENSYLRDKFIRGIADIVSGSWNAAATEIPERVWTDLGFKPEQVTRLRQLFKDISNPGNRRQRRGKYLISKPTLHKAGGILKAQLGTMVGTSAGIKSAATQTKTDKPIVETGDFANWKSGSGEKLSTHDWMELGAVLGDAASIGLSFVPGVHIATGVTGMAGSTAGFVADVRRDGYQGSDLTQYLVNLGLDSLSFLPGLGGVAKAGKVVRGLKKAAPVIDKLMKAAAIYGIGNAGVQSWEAIKSGNFNMRDLRVLVNVLGGVAHIGKSGVKKLTLKEGEVSYPIIKSKAGKDSKNINLSKEQLAYIKNKSINTKDELASELANMINKSKANGAPDVTKEQIIDLYDLDEFIKTRKKFLLFGEEKSKIKNLESKKGKGTFTSEYVTKNDKRRLLHETYRRILAGEPIVEHTYQGAPKTVTEMIPAGQWRPKYKTVREIQGVPQRDIMIAGENGVYAPSNNVPAIVNTKQIVVNEADKALPVVLKQKTRSIPGEKITSVHKLPNITPITSGIIWERTPDEVYSPEETIPYYETTYRPYTSRWVPVNQLSYKKGGKVLKGATGTPVLKLGDVGLMTVNTMGGNRYNPNWNPDDFKFNSFKPSQVNPSETSGFDPISGKTYRNLAGNWVETKPDGVTVNPEPKSTTPETKSAIDTKNDQGNSAIGTQGGQNGNPVNIDPTVPLNWLRAGVSMLLSNKQLKNFEKLPTLQMQAPLTNAPRYINSGSGQAYREAAKKMKLHKAISSDATGDWLQRQQELQKSLGYELQGDLADSQEYGKYNALLDDYNNKVALRNTDISNKNRELRYNRMVQGVQMKNANIAEKSKFFDQAAYATQDWITKQMHLRNKLRWLNETSQDRIKIQDDYKTAMDAAYKLTGDARTSAINAANLQAQIAMNNLNLKGEYSNLAWPFQFAKGGTVSKSSGSKDSKVTYSRDPYPDLLLQNSKAVDKFVEKLSDHTIKLILQAKPLYVSK